MAEKYAVIRTDLLSGTRQPADILSIKFQDASGADAEVENGVIVKVGDLIKDEREIHAAVAAKAGDALNECAIVASPEILYDERLHLLDEYVNVAGHISRAYIPRSRNIFGLTAKGFVKVPEVGGEVGIGDGGKLDSAGTGFGKCIAIESDGRYTYYVIQIGKTESAS